MQKYRIVKRHGKYEIDGRCLFGWYNLKSTELGGSYRYDSVIEAEAHIKILKSGSKKNDEIICYR